MRASGGERFFWWPVALLVLLWGMLYWPGLAERPTYYVDEGYAVDLARGWADGRLGGATYERPLAAYMPLHRWLLQPSLWTVGDPILWGRCISVGVILTIGVVLWMWFRRALGPWLALLPALWLMGYEQSVVLYRMAYPHALFGLGLLLVFGWWGSRWWVRAAGTVLCFWTHQFALPALGLAALCFCRRWRDLLVIGAVVVGSLLALAAGITWFGGWSFVLQDLGWQSAQLTDDLGNTGVSLWTPMAVAWSYHTQDLFHAVALLGALTGLWRRELSSVAYMALTSFLIWQRTNIVGFHYPDLLLMPLGAKVLADGLWAGRRLLERVDGGKWEQWVPRLWAGRRVVARAVLVVLVGLTVAQVAFGLVAVRSENGLVLRFQPWATQDMREFRVVADWLNGRSGEGDLVLANPTLASQLRATGVDWLTATLYRGKTTTFSPTPWTKDRFVRSLAPEEFRFVVVGDSDVVWALGQPNVEGTLAQFADWPVVLATLRFVVRENPRFVGKEGE